MFFLFLRARSAPANTNGTTNQDRTNYFETVPANELGLALWLESDRMGTLLDHVDQKTFGEQREVVKNERRQNYENAPYGLVPQFIHAAVFPEGHPYHLLTIGTPHDLDAATLDDVRAFFKTYYLPNNATLVIAGDFEPAKAKELVAKYFGPIAKGAAPPTKTKPIETVLAKETRLDVEADVELARIWLSWPTPAYYAPGDADLDLLASVLADGKSSRLYKRLVYDLQVAQDVSADQGSEKLGSMFGITVTVKKGKKAEDVLKLVDEEVDKLRKKPPAPDEVARAKTRFLSGKLFRVEGIGARADLINSFVNYVNDPNYFDEDLARHERVTAPDISAALAKWLPKDKRVVAIVTPTAGAPRAGRLKGAP